MSDMKSEMKKLEENLSIEQRVKRVEALLFSVQRIVEMLMISQGHGESLKD